MQKVVVQSLLGKQLSGDDVRLINTERLKEFGSPVPIDPREGKDDYNKIYFLAKVDDKVVAFGRLHAVTITFEKKKYKVFGIATIIAVVKGKGYGKILMKGIKNYIRYSQRTALGFCAKNITPFYQKCGFTIMPDGQKRFAYTTPPKFTQSDAFYVDGTDGLMRAMIEKPDTNATLSRAHW